MSHGGRTIAIPASDADIAGLVPGRGYNAALTAQPALQSLTPAAGLAAGGTSVTITGYGLTGATAVSFGANPATSVVVVNDTTITCHSPAGTGLVQVAVTTPGGQTPPAIADHFTYT